jgi:tetratricopeptide (TPR) repeat protein
LTTVGRYAEAQAAYLKLYKSKPVPRCAIKGLRDLAAAHEFSSASALIESGLRDEALKKIQSARAAAPSAEPPTDVVSFLIAKQIFDEVEALDKAGFHRTARERLRDYLEGTPKPAGGIPPESAILRQDQLPNRAQRLSAWAERNTDEGKNLLWALLVATGVVVVVLELARRLRRLVSFATFTGPAKDDDPTLSRSFSSELREAVANIGVAHGGVRPDLVLPEERKDATADLSTAFPQLRFLGGIVALLDRIVPSRGRQVTGHLQPATDAGVGTSIALSRAGGKILGQVTLRQGEYAPLPATGRAAGDASDYASLIAPATYWLLNELSAEEKLPPDWRAHALFASGARLQEAGDMRHARQLYEEALEYTPPLRDAQLNLAGIEIKEGASAEPPDVAQIARGIQRLLSVS